MNKRIPPPPPSVKFPTEACTMRTKTAAISILFAGASMANALGFTPARFSGAKELDLPVSTIPGLLGRFGRRENCGKSGYGLCAHGAFCCPIAGDCCNSCMWIRTFSEVSFHSTLTIGCCNANQYCHPTAKACCGIDEVPCFNSCMANGNVCCRGGGSCGPG
jgi:hypothetical protein